MGNTWENHEKMGKKHGKAIGKWKTTHGKPWENWKNHGNPMGQWEKHIGKP